MSYLVKEIFYSIQGEGFHSGRPAVFCRFAGCNLWSGKEIAQKYNVGKKQVEVVRKVKAFFLVQDQR